MQLNQVIKSVKNQFNAMQCLPLFEIEMVNDEYLLVNLAMVKKGIEFRFDTDSKPTFFSGDIIKTGDGIFLLKCDQFTDNLDDYLHQKDNELWEGYLMPNNLMRR